MTYISSGAKVHDGTGFAWCKTKKALRETLAANPGKVLVVTFGIGSHPPVQPEHLEQGKKYQVAGPHPEERRNWYTTLENRGGVIFMDGQAIRPVEPAHPNGGNTVE